jgi:hypothetical protein
MEILEQHRDLEAGRAMLGHTRIDTTQTYAQIRPAQLKRTVEFYEGKGLDLLSKPNLVAPTGFGSQASSLGISFQGLALAR